MNKEGGLRGFFGRFSKPKERMSVATAKLTVGNSTLRLAGTEPVHDLAGAQIESKRIKSGEMFQLEPYVQTLLTLDLGALTAEGSYFDNFKIGCFLAWRFMSGVFEMGFGPGYKLSDCIEQGVHLESLGFHFIFAWITSSSEEPKKIAESLRAHANAKSTQTFNDVKKEIFQNMDIKESKGFTFNAILPAETDAGVDSKVKPLIVGGSTGARIFTATINDATYEFSSSQDASDQKTLNIDKVTKDGVKVELSSLVTELIKDSNFDGSVFPGQVALKNMLNTAQNQFNKGEANDADLAKIVSNSKNETETSRDTLSIKVDATLTPSSVLDHAGDKSVSGYDARVADYSKENPITLVLTGDYVIEKQVIDSLAASLREAIQNKKSHVEAANDFKDVTTKFSSKDSNAEDALMEQITSSTHQELVQDWASKKLENYQSYVKMRDWSWMKTLLKLTAPYVNIAYQTGSLLLHLGAEMRNGNLNFSVGITGYQYYQEVA